MNPRVLFCLIFLIALFPAVQAETYDFTFTFNGECSPDDQVEVKAFDLTGQVVVSTSMQVGETRTFSIDDSFENLIWIVSCNGKEVYRKRYDLPGVRWKGVDGYPHDIVRADGDPKGTPFSSNTTANIRNPADCGNGEVDPGEGCDTLGDRGCSDPYKPVCYDCAYCGCGDANDCPWVSGTKNCGDAGCPPWSLPEYGRVCAEGVCLNPVKCVIDPACLDAYQGDDKPASKEKTTETHPLSVGPRVYEDPVFNLILAEERFGDTIPPVRVDEVGGMIFDRLYLGDSETYTFDGNSCSLTFLGPDCGVADAGSCTIGAFLVDDTRVSVNVGGSMDLENGIDLVLKEMTAVPDNGEIAAVFYLNALEPDQLLDLLYSGTETGGILMTDEVWKPEYGLELLGLDPEKSLPQRIDPALESFIGNDHITIYVENEISYLILEKGEVTEFGEGAAEGTTVRFTTDGATASQIRNDELTLLEAMDQGRVRISGEGMVNDVRLWAAKLFYDIGQLFS